MDEFDEICRRCTPVVYRFLLSLCKDASLADELTAETFYQAYLHIDTCLLYTSPSPRDA